jgi:hypothetical protein
VGGPVVVVQVEVVPLPMHVTMVVPVGLFVVQVEPVAVVTHVVLVVVTGMGGGGGELVRNPVSFTKANPDGLPVPVSNAITGTSEESRRLLPTTY